MNNYHRALQFWTLLVCAARERKTYGSREISKIIGLPPIAATPGKLNPVAWLCEERGHPNLIVLVVNETTGEPWLETGPHEKHADVDRIEEFKAERERVFQYNWFASEPPEVADFRAAMERAPPGEELDRAGGAKIVQPACSL